jgi:hypothetical protein
MPAKPTDIRIDEVAFEYEDHAYRAPIKFGGVAVDRVSILNVRVLARTVSGTIARGFGSMPLGNVWAYPSKKLKYDETIAAMKALAERLAKITGGYREAGHPVDINHALEPAYLKAADEVSRDLKLTDPIPKLCTLVVASPFDAAIHDAFGKAHGRNCYRTYGPDFMTHDLSRYLGPAFKGEYLEHYVLKQSKPRMPLYHLIGALDPLDDADVRTRINDGEPETLT